MVRWVKRSFRSSIAALGKLGTSSQVASGCLTRCLHARNEFLLVHTAGSSGMAASQSFYIGKQPMPSCLLVEACKV